MGRAAADIRKLCPGAVVDDGLPIRGSAATRSEAEIRSWVEKLNLKRK